MALFNVQLYGGATVVEFTTPSLMDRVDLEQLAIDLYKLIDAEDRRLLILDFARVQYLSSQAIGILLTMHKKLASLKKSKLILCGIGPRLLELIKITRLDAIFSLKADQKEALRLLQREGLCA